MKVKDLILRLRCVNEEAECTLKGDELTVLLDDGRPGVVFQNNGQYRTSPMMGMMIGMAVYYGGGEHAPDL